MPRWVGEEKGQGWTEAVKNPTWEWEDNGCHQSCVTFLYLPHFNLENFSWGQGKYIKCQKKKKKKKPKPKKPNLSLVFKIHIFSLQSISIHHYYVCIHAYAMSMCLWF
jgi:hypothetical protein